MRLLAEVVPIDDIRSTAEYRKCVAANLLEEFLTGLKTEGRGNESGSGGVERCRRR